MILHQIIPICQENYPETLKSMFFTNCPLVSKLFLMTLRRNLKRKTQSKVYISLGPLTSVRLVHTGT